MTREEIKQMANTCNQYHSCAACPYNPEDISRFIGDRWKGGCPNYDRKLVYAIGKGYGDVSEYEAERELLGSQIKVLKQRLNNKCIEVYNLNRDYTNSFERLKAQEQEIERLKAENCELTKKLEARLTCDFVKTAQKKAVKKFADEIKAKLNAIFGKTICSDLDTEDITDIIDELLKEYENGK